MKIAALADSYKTDPASNYLALRYHTRQHYNSLLRIIIAELGDCEIVEFRTRDLTLAYQRWSLRGTYMAHGLVGMLRTICNYGGTMLEDDACITLAGRMSAMRFKMGKPRSAILTVPQVVAIRKMAHDMGYHSIALAQAFQYDLMLRQRDVIGEYVPLSEPGESDVHDNGFKWLRGIRWDEIDKHLVLRHVTSKRQKKIEVDLKLAEMVMQELRFEFLIVEPSSHVRIRSGGPIIVREETELPWDAWHFRRAWREIARACGIPDDVRNQDTRAGAITEALQSGASPDSVRKSATHSDLSTTMRYSRGDADATAEVMKLRAEKRSAA